MNLARLIELAHRQAHRQWAKTGAQIGLSHSEFEYLCAIQDQEAAKTDKDNHGQHLQDVVVEMGVKKASASAMVLKLEERGLVIRIACQFDARAQHILLTEQGHDLLKLGKSTYEAAAKSLVSETSEIDFEALTAALAK